MSNIDEWSIFLVSLAHSFRLVEKGGIMVKKGVIAINQVNCKCNFIAFAGKFWELVSWAVCYLGHQ